MGGDERRRRRRKEGRGRGRRGRGESDNLHTDGGEHFRALLNSGVKILDLQNPPAPTIGVWALYESLQTICLSEETCKDIKQRKLTSGHWRPDPNCVGIDKWNQYLVADTTEYVDSETYDIAFSILLNGDCSKEAVDKLTNGPNSLFGRDAPAINGMRGDVGGLASGSPGVATPAPAVAAPKQKGKRKPANPEASEAAATGDGGVAVEVEPVEVIDKARALLALLKKDISAARGYHVSLKGLDVSDILVDQCLKIAVSLEGCYEKLQAIVKEKKNKETDYITIVQECATTREKWADRASYCKAVLSANGVTKIAKKKPAQNGDESGAA